MKSVQKAIVGILLIGTFSGCGSVNLKSEATIQKPPSISFATNVGLKPEEGFETWRQEYINQTGIDLEFDYIDRNEYHAAIEVGFSSANVPDVFMLCSQQLSTYALEGNLYDLTEMVEASENLKIIDSEIIDRIRVNGRIYGIPFERGGGTVTYIRQDWLDQLGLKQPQNYQEFIDVLRAFKTLGEDIIPFTAPGFTGEQGEYYLSQFYQDATPNFTINQEGKWIDGMTEPSMKAALERLKEAYAEGLIDPEIITNKTSTCRNKWYEGQVGVINYWAGNWAVSLEDRLKRNVKEAKIEAIPPISETQYIERICNVMSISSTCENPEQVFKYFIEYVADGDKGSMLFQHGVENIHYTIDDENKVKANNKIGREDEVFEKAFISPVLTTIPIQIEGYEFEVDNRVKQSLDILYNNCIQDTNIKVSEKLAYVNSDLMKVRENTIAKIVLGQVSIEEGLNEYRNKAEQLNVNQILLELNKN